VTADEVVKRLLSVVGQGVYHLQYPNGDYNLLKNDAPWSHQATDQCDCWGLIAWANKQPRHQPGYNRGSLSRSFPGWPTVVDDVNTDSALEDAARLEPVLWQIVPAGLERAGDVVVYHTIFVNRNPRNEHCNVEGVGTLLKWGHVAGLVFVGPTGWKDPETRLVQCHGPNGRRPGVVNTNNGIFLNHEITWNRDGHRPDLGVHVLRPVGT